MKHTNHSKIKTYTSFALALALVSPLTAFAAEDKTKTDTTTTNIEENLEKNIQEPAYKSEISQSLSPDGTKIDYEVNIQKTTENEGNLKAYIYLLDRSNFEKVDVLESESLKAEDVKVTQTPEGQKITIDLKNTKDANLKLSATIKEDQESYLIYDLVLVDESLNYAYAKRMNAEIKKDSDGKLSAIDKASDKITSVLSASFLGDKKTIAWSDYLFNPTDKAIKTNYAFDISKNQDPSKEKLNIETLAISENGFESIKKEEVAFGNIENLEIPAYGLAKLSFKTIAKEGEIFEINGVKVERILEEEKPEKPEEKVEKKDLSEDEVNQEAEQLIKDLNENTEKIAKELEEVEKLGTGKETTEEEKSENPQTKPADNEGKKEEDKDPKTVVLEENKSKKDEENKADKVSEETKKADNQTKEKDKAPVDVDQLVRDINNANQEISQTLKEVGAVSPVFVKNSPDLNQKDPEKSLVDIDKLINEINQAYKAIETEAKKIYGKNAYTTAMDLYNNVDSDTAKLLESLDKNNDKVKEIVDQVNLSIESKEVLDNPEETAKIAALLGDLTELKATTEKALESVEDKKENQSFNIIVDGFSQNVLKDLDKVVTITLDPLNKAKAPSSKKEAQEKYPTIAEYLNRAELRNDLLKNKR